MYGIKFELGLWCLTVRSTNRCYYACSLQDILVHYESIML